MKMQRTLTAAIAAFAGMSFATLYAAPSYTPNANSPINTTPLLDSTSQNLDNFDDFIGVIDAAIGGPLALPTDTLILPTPSGSTFPTFKAFNAAVAAAVLADPVNAQKIVGAAVQYLGGNYGGKVKDIVRGVATAAPNSAEDAVIGAIAANPLKAPDAAAGAILGVIDAAAIAPDFGDIADEAIDGTTHLLIEKVAKAAVAATKKSATATPNNAIQVARAIVNAVVADGVTLYIDDLARGITAGAKGIVGTSQGEVAAEGLARLNATGYENTKFVSEYVTGALKAVVISKPAVPGDPGLPSADYTAVLAALKAEASVGANFTAAIDAIDAAHIALRNAPGGTEAAEFSDALTAAHAGQLEAFMIGAVQNKPSKSHEFVTALFNDPDAGAPSVAIRQAVVGAAVRGKFSGAGKVTAAAIGSTLNSLTRAQSVQAAIPNATLETAGVITAAAVKTSTALSGDPDTTADDQPDDVASVALSAAVSAGYAGAINDIALQAVKARKKDAAAIVETLVANADSAGWREAIIAQAVINDKAAVTTLGQAAQDGATTAGSSDFEKASLALTAVKAAAAKASSKTAFDDAITDFYGAPVTVGLGTQPATDFSKAILFARGGVNIKNAGPLLALALKFGTNTTDAEVLAVAKSIYKKNATVLDLQYTVVKDALANPDQLFDLVDHQVFTHASKFAPEIVSAAVAARPEYAHFIARAASFRAPASAGKVGAAAITYGHMLQNRDTAGALVSNPDNPAAVAAISSATILGILDANLVTTPSNKKDAAVKNATAALVKAAILLEDDSETFRQSDGGVGTFNPTSKAKGSAAAVTGLLAQILGNANASSVSPDNAADTTNLPSLAKTVLTNAAKAAKKEGLQIAQAAAQVAQFIYQLNGGAGEISATYKSDIVAAIMAGNPLATGISNAVEFGVDEAFLNGNYGAGAAGILNYAHRSGTGAPVTSLENF